MTIEFHIETRAREYLRKAGCITKKMGDEGWPDIIVFYAPKRHFFIEFKGPDGQLTKAQKVRIPMLQKMGESVYVLDLAVDALDALQKERARP